MTDRQASLSNWWRITWTSAAIVAVAFWILFGDIAVRELTGSDYWAGRAAWLQGFTVALLVFGRRRGHLSDNGERA